MREVPESVWLVAGIHRLPRGVSTRPGAGGRPSRGGSTRRSARRRGSRRAAWVDHGCNRAGEDDQNERQDKEQAAELALTDTGGSGITLLTKDSGGSASTAQAAAQAALNEGAELILGPLLAPEVQAVKAVTQGRANVIAFSSASNVAGEGTYLMSFLPEEEVANVVRYAASQGKRSVALLYPQTQYGSNVQAALDRSAGTSGIKIAAAQPYARGQSSAAAAQRIAQDVNDPTRGVDALLIPEGGTSTTEPFVPV